MKKPRPNPTLRQAIGLRGQIASQRGFPPPSKVFNSRCPTCNNRRTITFSDSKQPCPRCRP